jgi:hypothetical protein
MGLRVRDVLDARKTGTGLVIALLPTMLPYEQLRAMVD